MIGALLERAPMTTKVGLTLRAAGITAEETKVLDAVIASLGTNPIVATLLGTEVSSLNGAVAATVDVMSGNTEVPDSMSRLAAQMLSTPKMRMTAASSIVKWVSNHEHVEALTGILHKLSELPLPGFGDTEYPDAQSFLAEGPLALISNHFQEKYSGDEGMVVSCPYCQETFIKTM
jgi:hypothetical protein